jgi:hypothetical protein
MSRGIPRHKQAVESAQKPGRVAQEQAPVVARAPQGVDRITHGARAAVGSAGSGLYAPHEGAELVYPAPCFGGA